MKDLDSLREIDENSCNCSFSLSALALGCLNAPKRRKSKLVVTARQELRGLVLVLVPHNHDYWNG
eukprot:scaffold497751_cov37-Prasinocladus_malaysianus.AAC.1